MGFQKESYGFVSFGLIRSAVYNDQVRPNGDRDRFSSAKWRRRILIHFSSSILQHPVCILSQIQGSGWEPSYSYLSLAICVYALYCHHFTSWNPREDFLCRYDSSLPQTFTVCRPRTISFKSSLKQYFLFFLTKFSSSFFLSQRIASFSWVCSASSKQTKTSDSSSYHTAASRNAPFFADQTDKVKVR